MFTKPAGETEHVHKMEVDGEGTGCTVSTSKGLPHTHEIKNWKVEEVDGHTHPVSTDYVKGTGVYGNGDEPIIIEDRTSVKDAIKEKTEVHINVTVGGLGEAGSGTKTDVGSPSRGKRKS